VSKTSKVSYTKRQHADALCAAVLHAQGWTHREIAELLGKRDDQIKTLILLGERLQQVHEERK